MSGMNERVEYDYSTQVDETRRMCDLKPRVYVTLTEIVTTTTRHDDGSVTTHETRPKIVGSWTYDGNDE